MSSHFVYIPYVFQASCVSPEAGADESSAREANFACKKQPHYSEEDGEDEQHIRRADHRVIGKFVRLASHLVYVEAYGEDECRHAEQDHAGEGDPAGVFGGFSAPVRCHKQSACDCEGYDAHDDEEKCGDPLWRQPRWNTCPVSAVDGLTLADEADCEGTC